MADLQEICDRIDAITDDKEFVQAIKETDDVSDFKSAVNEKIIDLLVQHQAASKRNGNSKYNDKKDRRYWGRNSQYYWLPYIWRRIIKYQNK